MRKGSNCVQVDIAKVNIRRFHNVNVDMTKVVIVWRSKLQMLILQGSIRQRSLLCEDRYCRLIWQRSLNSSPFVEITQNLRKHTYLEVCWILMMTTRDQLSWTCNFCNLGVYMIDVAKIDITWKSTCKGWNDKDLMHTLTHYLMHSFYLL